VTRPSQEQEHGFVVMIVLGAVLGLVWLMRALFKSNFFKG